MSKPPTPPPAPSRRGRGPKKATSLPAERAELLQRWETLRNRASFFTRGFVALATRDEIPILLPEASVRDVIAGLILLDAVSVLDAALSIVLQEREKDRRDLSSRIDTAASIGLAADSAGMHELRKLRNGVAHDMLSVNSFGAYAWIQRISSWLAGWGITDAGERDAVMTQTGWTFDKVDGRIIASQAVVAAVRVRSNIEPVWGFEYHLSKEVEDEAAPVGWPIGARWRSIHQPEQQG